MAVKSFEEYVEKHPKWDKQLRELKQMILETELQEAIKWGAPVYTLENKNVVGLGAFKHHCALWFFNGSLLDKNTELLVNAQEGKTKALRQIRFEEKDELPLKELKKYVVEAIQNQKAGREIKPKTNKKLVIPSELKIAFQTQPELEKAFSKLTKGKRREYADHIGDAKRESTRKSRLDKCKPMILEGKGLYDKYKNC